jgi:hypothetical protein
MTHILSSMHQASLVEEIIFDFVVGLDGTDAGFAAWSSLAALLQAARFANLKKIHMPIIHTTDGSARMIEATREVAMKGILWVDETGPLSPAEVPLRGLGCGMYL